jgi:hypothetical protein
MVRPEMRFVPSILTPHDLRALLQLPIDLLPPVIRDAGIDHRILDIDVAQMV